MSRVFISYRRDDSAGHAGRLFDRLVARFGASSVFMDVDDIRPGQNFEQAIEQTLSRCDHVLAVIGPRWLDILRARRDGGEDFVQREIVAALQRGRPVIPVLVGGARMPPAGSLPSALTSFARCNAIEIRDDRFDDDVADLIGFLAGGTDRRRLVGGIVAAVLVIAGLIGGYQLWAPPAARALNGVWLADMQKPGQNPFRVRLTFAQDAERVTGTVSYPTGDAPILDGRHVDGRLSFRTEHIPQFASDIAVIRTEGRVDGDSVHLTMTDAGGVATGVATRGTDGP